ncbi:MAG TPA: TRAFs-binding domain-containing protein [Bryobacteraceae bacterium]|nr:TRAFs-binding domain-containing protein [Bryobacteraceae bacterium]
MSPQPLCFVLMPFGCKPDPAGGPDIDFDRVYRLAIKPAIEAADMEPIRADEEKTGGIIHKPMFERLLLCEYAVADLTTANPNVFYELGVRHTARPRTTQPIFARRQPIPFDVNFLRALAYDLGMDNKFEDAEAAALRENLAERLRGLRQQAGAEDCDSPLFQLIGDWKPGEIAHIKTDIFRDQVRVSEALKRRMERARALPRKEGLADLRRLMDEMGGLDAHEADVAVGLMLAFRDLEGWTEMIELYQRMPGTLKRQVLVREQLGFAYNRRAGDKARPEADRRLDRRRAREILEQVERDQGPNSETCGLIGRIYKDLWDETRAADPVTAAGHLDQAIDAYVRGFEADPRDAYPGVNAVTLLEIRGGQASLETRDRLLGVVQFAVDRRIRGKSPDYWDHATNLELAVLASRPQAAQQHLARALASVRANWEPKTTARNLELIREARASRGENVEGIDGIIAALRRRAAE